MLALAPELAAGIVVSELAPFEPLAADVVAVLAVEFALVSFSRLGKEAST